MPCGFAIDSQCRCGSNDCMRAFSSAPFFVATTYLAGDGFCFTSCFFAKSALEKFYLRRRGLRTSFCPLVIVEGNFAGHLAQVGHAETAADLRDLSELADDTRDSATGDLALVWLQGLPGEFGSTSNTPHSSFDSDSGSLLRHCPL